MEMLTHTKSSRTSFSLHIGIIIVSLHRIEGIGPPKYLDPTQKDDVTR